MKINLSVLTKRDINGIEEWLKIGSVHNCPMSYKFTEYLRQCSMEKRFCGALFKKTRKRDHCPCGCYPFKYVRRRARYFVKKWKEQYDAQEQCQKRSQI